MPCGCSPSSVVTTVTPVAKWPITSRKRSGVTSTARKSTDRRLCGLARCASAGHIALHGGPGDLRAMQRATASWLVARPHVNVTVGDVEWWMVGSPPGTDWSERIRLWERTARSSHGAGSIRRARSTGTCAPMSRRTRRPPWRRRCSTGSPTGRLGGRLSRQPRARRRETHLTVSRPTLSTVTSASRRPLGRAGYVRAATPSYSHWYSRLTDDPAPPIVPAGYTLRHVRGPAEIEARVDVHRAAFAPSRMTVAKYERLLSMEHYAFERDLVVEAPDGSLAAFTMVWWDLVARVGEFEPVGVHPSHQRRGLGKAINPAGLRLLRDVGHRPPRLQRVRERRLGSFPYASVGFQRATYHRT